MDFYDSSCIAIDCLKELFKDALIIGQLLRPSMTEKVNILA